MKCLQSLMFYTLKQQNKNKNRLRISRNTGNKNTEPIFTKIDTRKKIINSVTEVEKE
ncbi:hypothetical protein [Candidatus Galacturonibacter soehngenii]|uniref:hypothetical protein n=1 Tax=Candidatus Galacturonatibacter soehngenii TaxID=2307010 RepID=UPI001786A009|nr:hypothetical protein [Candidatus Galacturonibacter soehngenii]